MSPNTDRDSLTPGQTSSDPAVVDPSADVVAIWTGAMAAALQTATRLSQEAFAARLGVGVRTVAKWHAKPEAQLRPATSEILDRVLIDADEPTRRRFVLLISSPPTRIDRRPDRILPVHASPEAVVATSQQQWEEVRRYLRDRGIGLAARAADLYPRDLRVGELPALSRPSWMPDKPVPIEAIDLSWRDHAAEPRFTGQEAEARPTLPLRSPGNAFARYSTAIRYIRPPALFENRHSYRLLDLAWHDGRGTMTFGLSSFFEKLDVGEPLSHEAALAELAGALDWPSLPFRSLIGDPFDLQRRPVNPGISTLTLRQDRATGRASFFLLQRNPDHVTNGRHYSLLPAGEFQPASIAADSIGEDLDLWRNIVREYSEEMLGQPEHDGSSGVPVDYETWPFYRDMTEARRAGRLRVYALGVVLDALSLNSSIATAAVFEDETFDRLFRDMVAANPEGDVLTSPDTDDFVQGHPFVAETVESFTTERPLGQTSAACLALAWQHRTALLG